jgi:hypothetical protein
MLPHALIEPLKIHLQKVKTLHDQDLRDGFGEVYLPHGPEKKYPHASRERGWQYVFPSAKRSVDPLSGKIRRRRLDESILQRAVKQAIKAAGIAKRGSCHTLRHTLATHLLDAGYDIRTIQELLIDKDATTTMIYAHVLNRGGRGVVSPFDRIKSRIPWICYSPPKHQDMRMVAGLGQHASVAAVSAGSCSDRLKRRGGDDAVRKAEQRRLGVRDGQRVPANPAPLVPSGRPTL